MILNNNTIFNCLIFYDYGCKEVQLEKLYEYILNFYKKYGQIPKRMSLKGKNIPGSSKTKSFHHYNKKIRGENFSCIDSLWMGGGYPEVYSYDVEDCYIGFHIDFDSLKTICLYFYNELIPFDPLYFQEIARHISQLTHAKYGAVYQKTRRQQCYGYSLSIGNSSYTDEEKKEISNWYRAYEDPFKDCGTYKTGDLRDIYPLNFISQQHLDRQVFGKPLKKWIEEDNSHGSITPLKETSLWTWEVNPENLPFLREKLKPTDLLVCFRPYL